MIPTLGLMLTVYAIARLMQVPFESLDRRPRWTIAILSVVSAVAIAILAFLAVDLIMSATRTPMPGFQ